MSLEGSAQAKPAGAGATLAPPARLAQLSGRAELILVPLGAIAVSLAIFGAFIAAVGVNPLDVYASIYKGAFGSWFSWQNTLQ